MQNQLNKLICLLIALENNAKDLHYNSKDYAIHLFSDRVADGLSTDIDNIKEICLLGHGINPLHSTEYLTRAIPMIPKGNGLEELKSLMIMILQHIETLTGLSKGDNSLIDDIASKIQGNLGLINMMGGK